MTCCPSYLEINNQNVETVIKIRYAHHGIYYVKYPSDETIISFCLAPDNMFTNYFTFKFSPLSSTPPSPTDFWANFKYRLFLLSLKDFLPSSLSEYE